MALNTHSTFNERTHYIRYNIRVGGQHRPIPAVIGVQLCNQCGAEAQKF